MTVLEVADYLRVHPTTLYKMLRHREIPAFRVGSDWRFSRDAIELWMSELQNHPASLPTLVAATQVKFKRRRTPRSAKRAAPGVQPAPASEPIETVPPPIDDAPEPPAAA